VGLVPAPGNPYYNSATAILQVGIINCTNPSFSVCVGSPRYFWAYGGCGDNPQPRLFGSNPVPPVGGITFAVRHIGNSTYWLTADPIAEGYATQQGFVYDTNYYINCWGFGGGADKPVGGSIYCERWDRGDSCGGIGASTIAFTTIRFQVSVDGQWYIPGNSGSPLGPVSCLPYHVELHCVDQGDDRFGTYAVQQ
jgi:hypothetical protein